MFQQGLEMCECPEAIKPRKVGGTLVEREKSSEGTNLYISRLCE